MPATLIADDPESRGRGSRGIAAEAIRTPQGQLILATELGNGLGEHGDLISIVLPDEVLMPLFPRLGLELLRGLLLGDLRDFDDLLRYQMLMQVAVLQRLLLIFLSLS